MWKMNEILIYFSSDFYLDFLNYGDFMEIKKLIYQFIKFGLVGVAATITDVGTLALLKEVFNVDVLVASAISFCVSVIVNYILSMKFVFRSKGTGKVKEFLIFLILSTGGFLINQLIMWFGVNILCRY